MLYIITANAHNHLHNNRPIGAEFNLVDEEACYYFVDQDGAPADFRWNHLAERDLNPAIAWAGKNHLAEWSFFLTELHRPFAEYPFFVVSSRFHDKNRRLRGDIATALSVGYSLLRRFGYAYLPSYDRDPGFEDLRYYYKAGHLAIRTGGLRLIDTMYRVRMIEIYRWFSDFFCNYIGFQSRAHFEKYVRFFMPMIHYFLTDEYTLIRDPEDYVGRVGSYRNEKPLTFLLELISHLFFYVEDQPFGGVSYDGGYRVDERRSTMRRICPLDYMAGEPTWLQSVKSGLPRGVRYGWSGHEMENDLRRAASQSTLRGEFVTGEHFGSQMVRPRAGVGP